jgi:hypothetical protein
MFNTCLNQGDKMSTGKYMMALAIIAGFVLFFAGAYALDDSSKDNGDEGTGDGNTVTFQTTDGEAVHSDSGSASDDASADAAEDADMTEPAESVQYNC